MGELGSQADDNKLRDFVKAILDVGPTRGPGGSRPAPPFVMADRARGNGIWLLKPSIVGIPTTGSMGGTYGRLWWGHPHGYDGQKTGGGI
jgi:hypothetical protein